MINFGLTCPSLSPPCTVDASKISYNGDPTITTTCPGITWTSNNAGGGDVPNTLQLFPSVPLVIPAHNPMFCNVEFDFTKIDFENPPSNTITQLAEIAIGYCDNGLTTGNFSTGSVIFDPTPTPTDTPTPTPTDTPTPTRTRPPISVVPSPMSPAGLLLIGALAIGLLWSLRRLARAGA